MIFQFNTNKLLNISNKLIFNKCMHIYRVHDPVKCTKYYINRKYAKIDSSSVTTLQNNNACRITIVGTHHFSLKSAEIVKSTIFNYTPHALGVELCPDRYISLLKDMQRHKNFPRYYYIRAVTYSILQLVFGLVHPEIGIPILYNHLRNGVFGIDLYTAIREAFAMNVENVYLIDLPWINIRMRSDNIFSYIKNYKLDLSIPPPIPEFPPAPWHPDDGYEEFIKYHLSDVPIPHITCDSAAREKYMIKNIFAMVRETKAILIKKGLNHPPWIMVVVGLDHLPVIKNILKKNSFFEIDPSINDLA